MTLYNSPEALLTYNPVSETLLLSCSTPHLSAAFNQAYRRALEEMRTQHVDKLLLDLKRDAPPTDEDAELLRPLTKALAGHATRPLFIAAVVSEGQYHHQIDSLLATSPLPPAQVQFNYFTSRRDATQWLSEN
ncbi:hypothetical protein [Hymenobacter canadensis]|uniref:STAS/SEC14 domain-containing protein n=1 Tax=Hymenobacter canadensis TaxID=2999067 RepID=A0ABY7LL81_9BACT|nr:hypothetical protein [Hymenobacter canadensis]WBA41158.1 hypothetical protein O3303_15195 [Hymenobacter canadensis]